MVRLVRLDRTKVLRSRTLGAYGQYQADQVVRDTLKKAKPLDRLLGFMGFIAALPSFFVV